MCNSTPPIILKIKAISPTRSFTVNGSDSLPLERGSAFPTAGELTLQVLHGSDSMLGSGKASDRLSNGPHQIPLVYPLPHKLLWCLIVEAMCVLGKIESICL